jgi:hypothetical protein
LCAKTAQPWWTVSLPKIALKRFLSTISCVGDWHSPQKSLQILVKQNATSFD